MRQKSFEIYLFFGNYEIISCEAFQNLANPLAVLNTGTNERNRGHELSRNILLSTYCQG